MCLFIRCVGSETEIPSEGRSAGVEVMKKGAQISEKRQVRKYNWNSIDEDSFEIKIRTDPIDLYSNYLCWLLTPGNVG